jgi:hypothetical protein
LLKREGLDAGVAGNCMSDKGAIKEKAWLATQTTLIPRRFSVQTESLLPSTVRW